MMPLTTWGFTIRPDGSLMISTTKQPGAFVSTRGITLNPDGSIYTQSYSGPITPAGSYKISAGFTLNSSGGLLTSPLKTPAGAVLTDGFYVNGNGAVYVSSTKQSGAKFDYRNLIFNPDGGLFAY